MNHHAGQVKNRNGIEYTIQSIPECLQLYQNWSEECPTDKHSIGCIADEVRHTIETDYTTRVKCTASSVFTITPTQGMPPIQINQPYVYRAFYNCKHSGLFHIKHNTTQKKYTFTVDRNMLVVLHDPTHEYSVGCPYSNEDRTVFSFCFQIA